MSSENFARIARGICSRPRGGIFNFLIFLGVINSCPYTDVRCTFTYPIKFHFYHGAIRRARNPITSIPSRPKCSTGRLLCGQFCWQSEQSSSRKPENDTGYVHVFTWLRSTQYLTEGITYVKKLTVKPRSHRDATQRNTRLRPAPRGDVRRWALTSAM